LKCDACSRKTASRYRRELTCVLLRALDAGFRVHAMVITAATPMQYADLQQSRGRMLADAKRRGLIETSATVVHVHQSGAAHMHVFSIGTRKLRRSDWTPLLCRHGLGTRRGFDIEPVNGMRRACALARYTTKQTVGLKARLERTHGPIRRLNAVVIPPTLRHLVGVVRRPRLSSPGSWLIFRRLAPVATSAPGVASSMRWSEVSSRPPIQ